MRGPWTLVEATLYNESRPVTKTACLPVAVGFDGTSDARPALAFAAHEADIRGTHLHLVHVIDPNGVASVGAPDFETAAKWVRDMTGGRVETVVSTRCGSVQDVLADVSRDVELLVVEHRRLSGLRRHRVPSIAVGLAGRVHSRMVSVPKDWDALPGGKACILVGVDAVDAEAEGLLQRAFAQASSEGARLWTVHAWALPNAYDDALVDPGATDAWDTVYRGRLRMVMERHRCNHADVDVTVDVVHQAAAKALVQRSDKADLVLVGQGRLVHPLLNRLGSVSRAVLENSRCPVEVVTSTTR